MNAPFFLTHKEPNYNFPKFAFIRPLKTLQEKNRFSISIGVVRFSLTDCTMDDVLSWADTAFKLSDYTTASGDANPSYFTRSSSQVNLRFVDVRTHDSLVINVESSGSTLKFAIQTDEIETAADII